MRLLDGIKGFLRKFKALVGSKPESVEVHAEPDSQLEQLERELPKYGRVYEGKVVNFAKKGNGAFVEILPGIIGMLHKSEIAHEFVENAKHYLQIGQQIKVKVIGFNEHRSLLSINSLDSSERELPKHGKVYEGKVVTIFKKGNGAFVNILPGIIGMLPRSEISHDPVENINDHLRLGQLIKVKVIEINDRGRVRLSMKALDDSKPKPAKEQTEPAAQPELG